MRFIINKVEENRDYLENKKDTIENQNEDGTITISKNILAFCYRIWIDNDINFELGFEYLYEIKFSNNNVYDSQIIEKGIGEYGNYMVLAIFDLMKYIPNGKDCPSLIIPLGQMEVNIILSPDMIKGSDKLLKAFGNRWPSFHEAELLIVDRTAKDITLRFYGGFLFDKVVDIIVKNIIFEEYDENLEYFTRQWLTNVEFRKRDNTFEIRLYNDYCTSSFPEWFDLSNLENPDFNFEILKDVEIVEKFKNHGLIKCNEIEINIKHEP